MYRAEGGKNRRVPDSQGARCSTVCRPATADVLLTKEQYLR